MAEIIGSEEVVIVEESVTIEGSGGDKTANSEEPAGRGQAAPETPAARTVVVGVDASPEAQRALAQAIEEARLRGWSLRIVHAFAPMPSAFVSLSHEDSGELRQQAEQELASILADGPSTDGVEVTTVVEPGDAANIILAASRDAGILVVGRRGQGGFDRLLLGSVASKALHHASSPVLLVH
jgi:nucleotide-binding universal stress UspA family protein